MLLPLAPSQLGAVIEAVANELLSSGAKITQGAALYCEKYGGFQCGTCEHMIPTNATHGRCQIVESTVHQTDGCCAMWMPDISQLHLYKKPDAS